MKKGLIASLFILLLTLSGCSLFNNTKMIHSETLDVTSLSSYYQIEDSTLDLYHISEDDYTDYVSIQDVLEILKPSHTELGVKERSDLTIYIPQYYQKKIVEYYKVVFDPSDNTIYIENFYMFLNISADYDLDYIFQFTADTSVYGGNEDSSITIDLDDYNFTIEKSGKEFFIPFHVASLLFSTPLLNMYNNSEEILLVEDFSQVDTIEGPLPEDKDAQTVIDDTANYLALVFDYYYGLKYFGNNELNRSVLRTEGIYDSTSVTDQANLINDLVSNASDLHTSIYRYGYNSEDMDEVVIEESSERSLLRQEYNNYSCNERSEEIALEEDTNYYTLHVNGFTLDTKDTLIALLEDIDPTKDIVIDLSCNLGGNVAGMLDLVSFLTNEDFYVHSVNSVTEHQIITNYTPYKQRGIENNFIIYTSGVSYSAANLFTQIVKTNNLGFVVGETTRGGGAVVGITSLPNGMILRFSSTRVYTDNRFDSIEEGVETHYKLTSNSVGDAMKRLYQNYNNYFITEITDTTYHNMVQINYSIREFLPGLDNIEHYRVQIFNPDGSLRYTSYSDTATFDFSHNAVIDPSFTLRLSALVKSNNTSFYVPLNETIVTDPDNQS